MHIRSRFLQLVLLLGSASMAFAQDANAIVHAHAEAIGGKQAIQAVHTLERVAAVNIGEGQLIEVTFQQMRPNLIRQDIHVQDMQITHAYDGKSAWNLNEALGHTGPEPMVDAEAKTLIRRAYMDDILWETQKQRQVKLAYQGKEVIDGRGYHKILVTFRDGFSQTRLYDVETALLHQIRQKAPDQFGEMQDTTTTLSDYRKVGDVKYPHRITNSLGQTVNFTETKINPKLDSQHFSMPAKAAAP